jgi:hypothetical protein
VEKQGGTQESHAGDSTARYEYQYPPAAVRSAARLGFSAGSSTIQFYDVDEVFTDPLIKARLIMSHGTKQQNNQNTDGDEEGKFQHRIAIMSDAGSGTKPEPGEGFSERNPVAN